ncbi:MAG: MYXO-CTERM domain-containing protein [Polyangiales bacterium]|jgi:MYXO-CTERM domain-containing protein
MLTKPHPSHLFTATLFLVGSLAFQSPVQAFCGFYVSGATAPKNRGSLVVLMRDGTRTIVSMQNDYEGPPEDFALIIPVPEVLSEEQVRTLPRDVFERLDTMTAPRLVEYWEQDPCQQSAGPGFEFGLTSRVQLAAESDDESVYEEDEDYGVTVEAEFAVGEYEIEILGARDSDGLERWLRAHDYQIPTGAEAALRPYVQSGMRFFVAKVSPDRVSFEDGRAVLSPLRFYYDAEVFSLPIRLGLLNADGPQDVIVHVLARGHRFEVANYDNYAIPTNIRVSPLAREHFGAFYEALFERASEGSSRAVLTEYAWGAGSCDPCPGPVLDEDVIVTLGADVTPTYARSIRRGLVPTGFTNDFVVTRLHLRYDANSLGDDLIFRTAPPITGGRGTPDGEGNLIPGVESYGNNSFQARYAILHDWEAAVECENPQHGRWGGPPGTEGNAGTYAAAGLAFAAPPSSGLSLSAMLDGPLPELGASSDTLPSGEQPEPNAPTLPAGSGCSRCGVGGTSAPSPWGLLFVFALFWRRRRDARR